MKIGLYQHGAISETGVAAAILSLGNGVAVRNAFYFNEREAEKFESVVVDDGVNTDAIRATYEAAGIKVVTMEKFLATVDKEKKAPSSPAQPSDNERLASIAKSAADTVGLPKVPADDEAARKDAADKAKLVEDGAKSSTSASNVPTAPLNPDKPRGKGRAPKTQGK